MKEGFCSICNDYVHYYDLCGQCLRSYLYVRLTKLRLDEQSLMDLYRHLDRKEIDS